LYVHVKGIHNLGIARVELGVRVEEQKLQEGCAGIQLSARLSSQKNPVAVGNRERGRDVSPRVAMVKP
jgi:hypothetical protein